MSKLLTTPEAAAYLGLKPSTLVDWRYHRVPHQPPYIRIGRKILYEQAVLDEYLKACRVDSQTI